MLTASERNYLLESMDSLLYEYDYDFELDALEDIIDEWARQKAGFIEAFKKHPNYVEGKFMIAFDADYERGIDYKASRNFGNWVMLYAIPARKGQFPQDIQEKTDACAYVPQDIWDFFHYLGNYATRCITQGTADYINHICPAVHAHAGQKTSRVVNKLCCYLGLDKVDGYNREFAKYADSLSPLTIKRHTVLSINPLDYLTMSFGNSWASCHTIDKENRRGMPNDYSGCYSSGTISYMLDPSSMVLYTVDSHYDGDEYWDQPKINRQMFHYGEEKLVQGRLYPQDNDGDGEVYTPYRNIVQNIISIIFDFPNLWTITKGTDNASRYINSYGTHYRDYHYYSNCSLSRVKGSENDRNIVVGASPICVKCGERHREADNINCCNKRRCADCGRVIDEDESYYVDGEYYCRDCVSYCDHCGEYHRGENTWVEREWNYVCPRCLDEYYIQCEDCGEYVREHRTIWVDSVDRYVCEDCLDDGYTTCHDCGEYVPNDEVFAYGYYSLCESCYDSRNENEPDEDEDDDNEAC